jgi:hypothetical protein
LSLAVKLSLPMLADFLRLMHPDQHPALSWFLTPCSHLSLAVESSLQVLADFLRLMHQRKEEEVQHVNSQICDLARDIQQVCVCMCV